MNTIRLKASNQFKQQTQIFYTQCWKSAQIDPGSRSRPDQFQNVILGLKSILHVILFKFVN